MKIKKYYVSGNTAEGFVDLLSSNLHEINKTIELKHSSLKMNTAILERIIADNKDETQLEILLSPISNQFLEGVILREKKIAILGRSVCPPVPEFEKGLKVHDALEEIYIKEMDFKKADQAAEELIQKLLGALPKKERDPHVFRRFFGTNTLEGVVNEVPHLISTLDHVYHIKGRAGTGKSTFMKKIANACVDHGLDIELYHCSFDPNSIDMVLVPALNICLFDSTDPHAFEPIDLKREEIIDLYEIAVTPGTDEKYQEKISEVTANYKNYMKKGLEVLKQSCEEQIKKEQQIQISTEKIEKEVKEIQSMITGAS